MFLKTRLYSWIAIIVCTFFVFNAFFALPAHAQKIDVAYQMALTKGLGRDDGAIAFYKNRNFKPLWMQSGFLAPAKYKPLLQAFDQAAGHALPVSQYDANGLRAQIAAVKTTADMGRVEAQLTNAYLAYVRDIRTGVLNPARVSSHIARKKLQIDSNEYLTAVSKGSIKRFLQALPPQSQEYSRLITEKEKLLKVIANGGWGPRVPNVKLQPGSQGQAVVALRDRLMAMGYLGRSVTAVFDGAIQEAVQKFQIDHGLSPDGIVGSGTRSEINVSAQDRLASIVVAMERERWTSFDKGDRHVWVNLADFTAKIMNKGQVEFQTRAVIGKNRKDQRSPEFSDEIEHMVINPTWNVPRSITVKEYLPKMQANPYAHNYLNLINQRGQVVSRDTVDFTQYNERNFPFDLKQPPSDGNALGLVKFMFPNKYNIYLHDTPSKSLFARETRAFSHGCIRLHKPFDFAYQLLSVQTNDPKGTFHRALDSGRETVIELEKHVPVHLMYRTAITKPTGGIEFRRDIYGRDAAIFKALTKQGVVIGSIAR